MAILIILQLYYGYQTFPSTLLLQKYYSNYSINVSEWTNQFG